ncbi:sugar transferase [Silvibacterium dinghuense]|uniref:sugar transferase n=1 Tax=Silvibacterium dinghuense TaxID=1560006 RepID=UPI0013E98D11|nr:sugar transferase [Silvibacterium dinghuense]GGG89853.1 UDP-phosphate galactose phosphotransferase [Silvibacterium dinghuense]
MAGWPGKAPRRSRIFSQSIVTSMLMMLNDTLVILLAFAVSLLLRAMVFDKVDQVAGVPPHALIGAPLHIVYLGWFVLSYLLVANRYGLYSAIPLASGWHEVRLTVQASLNAGLLLCGALYLAGNLSVSRVLVLLLIASTIALLCTRRIVWRKSRFRQFERGLETRNVVILGTHHLSNALGQHIEKDYRLGYKLRGYVVAPECANGLEVPRSQVLGGVEGLRQLIRQHFIDEIVIAEPCPTESVIQLLEEARELEVDIRAISGYYGELTADTPIEYLGIFPVVSLHRRDPRTVALVLKRGLDMLLSLMALAAVFPIMLAIAIAVRLDSEGPIFYVSERIGKRGRVFPCFKFRTMVKNAEQLKKDLAAQNERDGILFKMTNDPRITRVGRILRKYSLDELPQFFNVLRGEMSMVGPRPPIASEVAKYELEHFRRLEVLPGLTGLWQVQARGDSSFAKYIALDTAYVENWSFWMDLKILVRTAEVVFRGTGS